MDDHYIKTVSSHPFLIYKQYGIIPENYDQMVLNKKYGKKDPTIGNDVWIGSDSNILRGVEVKDGAVIGANSTVTKDIPPYAIAVGTPCRIIGFRFDEKDIEKLLEIQWWNWDESTLRLAVTHMYDIKDFIEWCEKNL